MSTGKISFYHDEVTYIYVGRLNGKAHYRNQKDKELYVIEGDALVKSTYEHTCTGFSGAYQATG